MKREFDPQEELTVVVSDLTYVRVKKMALHLFICRSL
ncbi:hypothetical protein J2S06_003072 [Bacillus alveayuensis]|uniref:Transposase n=1 Tax=Aeribacillus alveayuensis TaxID=279215 RepID=A0ABT9VSU1_9BACI|nr:hypothetical protein [Bacillus alveayuensis]